MINYCHLPWLYYWSFTGFPVHGYLLFTWYHHGCGMESLYIWNNFLWYASLRTDLASLIRICSTLWLSISEEIWFGPSALLEILLVSEGRNAQEGKDKDLQEVFPLSAFTPYPLPQMGELSMLARSWESLEEHPLAWISPTPSSWPRCCSRLHNSSLSRRSRLR